MANSSNRTWLILSYFSLIDGMACAQHLDDRIPYLRAKGITPIILSGPCGQRWPDTIQARTLCLAPSGIRFELRHLRRKNQSFKTILGLLPILLLPFYFLEKLIVDLDSHWSWFPLATLRGYGLCKKWRPELIYSTGGPPWAHLAGALISRATHLPWIAETQDPIIHEDWARSRAALKIYARLERYISENASAVVFVTEGARSTAKARNQLQEKGVVIHPGAAPESMPETRYRRTQHCRIAHFGSLGGSRNLKVFLEALQQALDENPELHDTVRLDLYGTCDGLSRKCLRRFPYPEMVRDHGRVPREEALEAMKQSDVLLLIQNTEAFSAETIPSKTYEYLLTERPILGLVHRNPELETILRQQGHMAVAATDIESVKIGLLELIRGWQSKPADGHRPHSFPITVEAAVDQLVVIADQLKSPPCPGSSLG